MPDGVAVNELSDDIPYEKVRRNAILTSVLCCLAPFVTIDVEHIQLLGVSVHMSLEVAWIAFLAMWGYTCIRYMQITTRYRDPHFEDQVAKGLARLRRDQAQRVAVARLKAARGTCRVSIDEIEDVGQQDRIFSALTKGIAWRYRVLMSIELTSDKGGSAFNPGNSEEVIVVDEQIRWRRLAMMAWLAITDAHLLGQAIPVVLIYGAIISIMAMHLG